MCGIVGIIRKRPKSFTHVDISLFTEMLITNAVRGDDGTGAFVVDADGNADYIKIAAHPFNLINSKEFEEFKLTMWNQGRAAIGHNRAATEGPVDNSNSHPFVFGPIILIHNGNITNYRSLLNIKEREKLNVNVSSHAAAVLIGRNSPKIVEEFHGSFALVWYDALEKKLYFIRNEERPLCFVNTDEAIYFASEEKMLKWLLDRHNIKFAGEITLLKDGHLISIALGDTDYKWGHEKLNLHKVNSTVIWPSHFVSPNDSNYSTKPDSSSEKDTSFSKLFLKSRKTKCALVDLIPEDKRYNIHYGNDIPITTENNEYLQILWSVQDFREINGNKQLWTMWGNAHNSEYIECVGTFQGPEREAEKLAYEGHVLSFVRRVKEKYVLKEKYSEVVVVDIRPTTIVEVRDNRVLTQEHFNYLKNKGVCFCGNAVKGLTSDDLVFCDTPSEGTIIYCDWCNKAEKETQKPNEENTNTPLSPGQ